MPIYEYECTKCNHYLEEFQKISDAPLVDCPNCHEASLSKLVSAAGFQLKGSGWYVTDYSTKGKARDVGKESTETTSSQVTETKTEADSGSKSQSTAAS